jgi:radical SAM protein with 4Fe4S-binding SPASM domain
MKETKTYLSAPIEVGLDVTSACNLKCLHCYASSNPRPLPNELTKEELINLVEELGRMQVFRLFLGGGEPFLRKELLIQLVGAAKKNGISPVLSTNGTLVDKKSVEKLKIAGLDNAQISIDGYNPHIHDKIRGVPGTFNLAVKAVRLFIQKKIPVTIGTVINRYNYDYVEKLVELAIKLKTPLIHFMEIQPAGRGKEKFKELSISEEEVLSLYEKLNVLKNKYANKIWFKIECNRFAFLETGAFEKWVNLNHTYTDLTFGNCSAGRTRCTIDAVGDVFGCDMLRHKNLKAGNIRENSFKMIWETSKIFKKFRERGNKIEVIGCESCKYKKICQGCCPGASFNLKGSIFLADPRCPIAKIN